MVVGGVLVHHPYSWRPASFVVSSSEAARSTRPRSRANRSVELEPAIVMAEPPARAKTDEVAVGLRGGGCRVLALAQCRAGRRQRRAAQDG